MLTNEIKKVVTELIKKNKTISVMESCTGGGLANLITNINDASSIFKFGAVTYSNESKIKMGIPEEVIKKYSVYSMEVAYLMSKAITDYTNSDYGVGITGKLNSEDPANYTPTDNKVFISVYNKKLEEYKGSEIEVNKESKSENKEIVLEEACKILLKII